MSRPSFQFYHGDWFSNAKLRFCSKEEKGHWIDTMCLLADADEFGILREPLSEICKAIGGKMASMRALVQKGVLKGADKGQRCEAYLYTPRSGRKNGPTVVLIPEQDGPIWYSSKMVRDDHIAKVRAEGARNKAGNSDAPKEPPKGGIGEDGAEKKEAVAKQKSSFTPPDWVPMDSWEGWLEMRKKKRAPNTEKALRLAVKDLDKLREDGVDPRDVLDQSTKRGWTGLFDTRGNVTPMRRPNPKAGVAASLFGKSKEPEAIDGNAERVPD